MIDVVLASEGWPYASASQGPGDPGRYHMLFGRDTCDGAAGPARASRRRARHAARARRAPGPRATIRRRARSRARSATSADEVPEPFAVRGLRPSRRASSATTARPTRPRVVPCHAGDARVGELDARVRAAAGWLERALAAARARPPRRGRAAGLAHMGWRDTIDPTLDDGGGFVREDGTTPVAADRRRRLARDGRRRPRRRGALGDEGWRRRPRARRASGASGRTSPRSRRAMRPCRAPAPSSAGCCGPTRSRRTRREAAATASPRPTSSPTTGCGRCRPSTRGSPRRLPPWLGLAVRLLAGLGGLRAAGRAEAAERVRRGVLARARDARRRLELYVVERDGGSSAAPLANRSQAWTVGARWALEHGWDGRAIRSSGLAGSSPRPAAAASGGARRGSRSPGRAAIQIANRHQVAPSQVRSSGRSPAAAPMIGKTGTNGTRNPRSRSGRVRRSTITPMLTITNANSVPMLTSSAIALERDERGDTGDEHPERRGDAHGRLAPRVRAWRSRAASGRRGTSRT